MKNLPLLPLAAALLLGSCYWSESWTSRDEAIPAPPNLIGTWESVPAAADQRPQRLRIDAADGNLLRIHLATGDGAPQELEGWVAQEGELNLFTARQQTGDRGDRFFLGAWRIEADQLDLAIAADADAAQAPYVEPARWLDGHADELVQGLDQGGEGVLHFHRVRAED